MYPVPIGDRESSFVPLLQGYGRSVQLAANRLADTTSSTLRFIWRSAALSFVAAAFELPSRLEVIDVVDP